MSVVINYSIRDIENCIDQLDSIYSGTTDLCKELKSTMVKLMEALEKNIEIGEHNLDCANEEQEKTKELIDVIEASNKADREMMDRLRNSEQGLSAKQQESIDSEINKIFVRIEQREKLFFKLKQISLDISREFDLLWNAVRETERYYNIFIELNIKFDSIYQDFIVGFHNEIIRAKNAKHSASKINEIQCLLGDSVISDDEPVIFYSIDAVKEAATELQDVVDNLRLANDNMLISYQNLHSSLDSVGMRAASNEVCNILEQMKNKVDNYHEKTNLLFELNQALKNYLNS